MAALSHNLTPFWSVEAAASVLYQISPWRERLSWLWPSICAYRVATSSCRGHVDEVATEPLLLLHREHRTLGYRRSWNCCDRRTRFAVNWKHFCFILSTGTGIRIDSVMCPRSSSRGGGAIQVHQLQLQLQLSDLFSFESLEPIPPIALSLVCVGGPTSII